MGIYTVVITGASGSVYGMRLVQQLLTRGYGVTLVFTDAGRQVTAYETGFELPRDEGAEAVPVADQVHGVARLDVLREHEDRGPRIPPSDLPGRLESFGGVARGHADIDDDHVRLGCIDGSEQAIDITGLAAGTYNDGHPVDAHGNPGGIFNRSWVVSDPLGFNSSRRVQVSVSWNRLGRVRTVQLDTIIRGNGI